MSDDQARPVCMTCGEPIKLGEVYREYAIGDRVHHWHSRCPRVVARDQRAILAGVE